MKNEMTASVTPENFLQCWTHVDDCRRIARRKAVISRIGGLLSNLLFLLLVVFLVNGLIYNRTTGSYRSFLKTLPLFVPLWDGISATLLKPDDSLYMDAIRLLAADYLVSFLFFCAVAGLVMLLCHPRKKAAPEGSYPEQLKQLLTQARQTRTYASRTKISTSPLASVLAILTAFVLFFSYAFYLKDAKIAESLLSIFPFDDAATNAMLYVLFGLIISSILCEPLLIFTRFLYRYQVSADMVNLIARSLILAEPEIAVLDAEGRKKAAASVLSEAVDLEKTHMYREAKEKFLRAAHLGNTQAMEHYARHCLIGHEDETGKYWLEKCVATGEASEAARKMLKKVQLRRRPDVRYLDNEKKKKNTGIRAVLRFVALLLTLALMVGTCYGFWLFLDASNNPDKHPQFNQWMDQMRGRIQEDFPELAAKPANTVTYYKPNMTLRPTLTWDDQSWDAPPLLHDNNGNLIPVCYTLDIGGDLYIPVRDIWAETAYLYTGVEEEMLDISQHIRYDSDMNTLIVSEAFLLTLTPGEYYIIPQFWDGIDPEHKQDFAYGVIVEETSTQCSLLAGLSASGDRDWNFMFDLDDPKDIVLPFHSIGCNPIVGVRRAQIMTSALAPDSSLAPEYFSIDKTGSVVTIKKEYLEKQTLGDHFALEFIRADGRGMDMNYRLIGILQGDNTGTLTLLGPDTHALSGGKDYASKFQMNNASQIMHVEVWLNDSQIVNADPDHVDSYIDYTTSTLTIPAGKFKVLASPGDSMEIRIHYTLITYQSLTKSFTVQFTE